MKLKKLIAFVGFLGLVFTTLRGQAYPEYVHIITKANSMSIGTQIGCTCYKNVNWQTSSTSMTAEQKKQAQPLVKPDKTQTYDLYEKRILKERHTVVVVDLVMRIQEPITTNNFMESKTLTFIGELANVGNINIYPSTPVSSIVKDWVLNERTPVLPRPVSQSKDYKIMDDKSYVQKPLSTRNDMNNANLIDIWQYAYTVNLKGKNCTGAYEQQITTSIPQTQVINVYKLWIKKFQDYETGNSWKVVVGKEIEKEANATLDCTNFGWEMPEIKSSLSDKVWHLQDVGNGNLKIPLSDLSLNNSVTIARIKNSDFGDTYGGVKVFCKDNYGAGNWHTTLSRGASMGNNLVMKPSKAVKVYFPKDVDLLGSPILVGGATRTGNTNTPLWFMFWKEGDVVEGLRDVLYLGTIDYGRTIATTGLTGFIGQVCVGSNAAATNDGLTNPIPLRDVLTRELFAYGGSGVHNQCLAEILVHEYYHKACLETLGWYSSINDLTKHSDKDWIPDIDEENPGELPYPGSSIFPHTDKNRQNSFGWKVGSIYDIQNIIDNEIRCRVMELNWAGKWQSVYHKNRDWSADIYNENWQF